MDRPPTPLRPMSQPYAKGRATIRQPKPEGLAAPGLVGIRQRTPSPSRRSRPGKLALFRTTRGPWNIGMMESWNAGISRPALGSPKLGLFCATDPRLATRPSGIGFVSHHWTLPDPPSPRCPILPKFGFVLRNWSSGSRSGCSKLALFRTIAIGLERWNDGIVECTSHKALKHKGLRNYTFGKARVLRGH